MLSLWTSLERLGWHPVDACFAMAKQVRGVSRACSHGEPRTFNLVVS